MSHTPACGKSQACVPCVPKEEQGKTLTIAAMHVKWSRMTATSPMQTSVPEVTFVILDSFHCLGSTANERLLKDSVARKDQYRYMA